MIKDLAKLAKEILEKNQYMAIASCGISREAWVSPVVYANDKNWNFYFVSIPSSRHCQNFKENNKIAFAIFDSHQLYGEGVGLQIEGVVSQLSDKTEIVKAAAVFYKRKYPYRKVYKAFDFALKKFLERKIYSFYKIEPIKIWMNNPNVNTDERVEIKLL